MVGFLIFLKHFSSNLEKWRRYTLAIQRNKLKEIKTMNKNDQEFLVQKIRSQYTDRQHTELDELKTLDAKVKKPAAVFAYIYGAASAIIMGAGMSLVMTDIGAMIGMTNPMVPGVIVGVVGMGMALSTYPIYKKILNSRKKKYAAEIVALSDKIMKG
jgi:hypothetical protein